MFSSAWLRFGLLMAATGLFALATMPAMGREPRAHGQRLVAQYQLPPQTIARYAALAAGHALEARPREDSRFADHLPWVGPEQRAGVGQNPYTLVLTVNAVAKTAGEVFAQWQAGWDVRESPLASRELVMAVPRLARTEVAAGQPLSFTASSARVSFRGQRTVAPMLGLVQVGNLEILDVQLQVWSGEAPRTWPVPAWSGSALLALGVACLAIGLLFKVGHRAAQARAAPPLTVSDVAPAIAARPAVVEPALVPAPAPSNAAQVMAALHQVLVVGLSVPTVLDEARTRQDRSAR